MDSSPSPCRNSTPTIQPKSASRLARINNSELPTPTNLSLDLVSYSPIKEYCSSLKTISPKPRTPLSLHDLLLLSPSPLRRSSRTRLSERAEMVEDPGEQNGSRRRCKNRNGNVGLAGCASPRNGRRLRRRLEQDIREEKDLVVMEELVGGHKPRKRRTTGRSKKEKLSSGPSIPSPKGNYGVGYLDGIGKLINDLIMWNDVAKSSLWFGFGSVCFLSSCFAVGINYSIFSLISQLGLLYLGFSFLSNSIIRRDSLENRSELNLKEEDILRVGRIILPAANLAISKARELFSGEPTMTLKVAPFLLIGAEYGHLITFWRLCALGFFLSFTCPKLYSTYSVQIHTRAGHFNGRVREAWDACSHKKIVTLSAATAFWNLTSLKTRIFTAFILVVLIRYHRQHSASDVDDGVEEQKQEPKQALVAVESGAQK